MSDDDYQPVEEPLQFARVAPAAMARMLSNVRAGGGARGYAPRWSGDGRAPAVRTHKPGAFRDRWAD